MEFAQHCVDCSSSRPKKVGISFCKIYGKTDSPFCQALRQKKRDVFWSDRPSPSPPRPGASGDHPTPVGVRLDCQVKRQRPPNVGKHFAGNTLQTAVCSNVRWPGDAVVHGFDTLSGYHPTAAPSPRSKGLQSSVIATAGRRLHHRLVWQAPAESSTPCFRKRNVRSRHP